MNGNIDTDSLAFLVSDCARLMRAAFERRVLNAGFDLTAGEIIAAIGAEVGAVQEEATQGLDRRMQNNVRQALKRCRQNLQKIDGATPEKELNAVGGE